MRLKHNPENACPERDAGVDIGFPKKIVLKQNNKAESLFEEE